MIAFVLLRALLILLLVAANAFFAAAEFALVSVRETRIQQLIDAKRIGAYGISWGGRTVMNLAALDRRVAACAISGHFNDLIPKMLASSPRSTAYIDTPEDYAFFNDHFRLFNDADVVSLICPRPVFIEQGRKDTVAYWEASERAFQPVKEIYEKLGIGERAVYSIFEGPHEVRGVEAFAFFDRWLKPVAPPGSK